jgi:hypothetical protein
MICLFLEFADISMEVTMSNSIDVPIKEHDSARVVQLVHLI